MPDDVPPLKQDMSDSYNTKLSDEDEQKFQAWATANPRMGNTADYDARGFWKDGAETIGGHGSDKWKKPNHPTFSDESIYHGKDGYKGGHWTENDGNYTFKPSDTNLQNMPAEKLADYFRSAETSNVKLLLPQSRAEKRYGK